MENIWHFILSRWAAVIHDLVWIPIALVFAYLLRFNLDGIPEPYWHGAMQMLLFAIPIQGIFFWYVGLYQSVWRFASIPDLLRIFQGVVLGTLVLSLCMSLIFRMEGIPRSVLLLYPLLLIVGVAVPRLIYRWFKDHRFNSIDDLLARDVIELDTNAIADYIQGKCILITGAGGSIGSELCRQLAEQKPKKLLIFEHSEFNLYQIKQELRTYHPGLVWKGILGDVKDVEHINWLFKTFKPQVVFHAAAYKHVPILESNPVQGVMNNVFGTKVVADASVRYKAECFVLVSTDKAVHPANVMGTTKRIAELYCQNLAARSDTRFITTRFGNVLDSAGSVVPLFRKQIHEGGPVTVTHPEITRYFMTIPESVRLILQAGAMGEGGEIFVLDMGKPILIRELAEQMIRLSGRVPGRDIKIVYTGLRPGEKLHEQLFHEKEGLKGTDHPKLMLAESRQVDWHTLLQELDELFASALERDIKALFQHLKNIVPEYSGKPIKQDDPAFVKLRLIENKTAS